MFTITKDGFLMRDARGKLRKQYCPFGSSLELDESGRICGDWCPLFMCKPQENGNKGPTGKIVLRLACSTMDVRIVALEE